MGAELELFRDVCRAPNLVMSICGIVSGIVCTGVTTSTASFTFAAGEGAIGIEWGVTDGAHPDSGTLISAGSTSLTVTDLPGATELVMWMRTKCLGAYSGWASVSFETETPVLLDAEVALYPRQALSSGHSASYFLLFAPGLAGFVNTNALLTHWIDAGGDNPRMLWERYSSFLADSGAGGTAMDNGIPLMASKGTFFQTMDAPNPGDYRIIWGDPTTAPPSWQYVDADGNKAIYSPLVLVNDDYSTRYLMIAAITMEVVARYVDHVRVRITRSHAAVTAPDVELNSMVWTGEATGGTADPDDLLNFDKRILTLTAGVYRLGVEGHYNSIADLVDLPVSTAEMVIEVV